MGMLDLLLGKKSAGAKAAKRPVPAASTQFAPSQSTQATSSPHQVRKDVLKLVLRELLMRNGIPNAWLSADLLRTTNSKREQGIHVRFLMRHFEPRLLQHAPALEQEFVQRLMLLDPLAADWLMGFSWQFTLDDISKCPPLPNAGAWTAPPQEPAAEPVAAAPEEHSGDVIAGPVFIPKPVDEVRSDLERLLSLRDEDMKRHSKAGDNFAPTRPAKL
ncbi:hypothetical protein WG902_14070 [Ramlibacter sp. PS3R-8]|uniref:hypothetical protein n=1 Tax=Ramlibacter sp. PS3R-8 TaxID=3133437 RepID=UPI00309873C6